MKCYIEKYYKIPHEDVDPKLRNKFVIVGKLFAGNPICSYCLQRISLAADAYGYSQIGNLLGDVTNVEAFVPLEKLIARSLHKKIFEDYDLADIKYQLDRYLTEVEPSTPIRESFDYQINHIRKLTNRGDTNEIYQGR